MSLVVLNSEAIDSCIRSMAASICAREGDMPIAIVGIRRGGEHLAQRLAREVEKVSGTLPPLGMVDITLYRDDGFGRSEFPEVGVTDLPFDIKTHTVILMMFSTPDERFEPRWTQSWIMAGRRRSDW